MSSLNRQQKKVHYHFEIFFFKQAGSMLSGNNNTGSFHLDVITSFIAVETIC